MVERKDPGPDSDELYRKVGLLTRQLHDSLRELGYDRQLESAVSSLPDARNRLSYISRLTGQAAEKVLNGVDRAKAELDGIAAGAAGVAAELRADPVAAVASGQVMTYLEETRLAAERADAQLTEIMLAQDFHDLTGQVIRKVVALAQSLESQLVELLLASTAGAPVPAVVTRPAVGALSGPAVTTAGRTDVVSSQSQVDDLLESLGF
jgi:chemotaxis protein CheZ